MKPLHLLLPLLLSYLIGLLVMLPARFAIGWLPLPPGANLQGVSGTLWQGQAQTLRIDNQQLGPFTWDWKGAALLQGQIAAQVALSDPRGISGKGSVGWNGEWNVDDATLHFPAAVLHDTLALSAEFSGDVSAQLSHLRFTPQGCVAARATLNWKNGGVTDAAGALNTGDTRIQVKCANKQWRAEITQASEQLKGHGQVSLSARKDYRLQGEITPGPTFPPALLMLLTQGARQEKSGQFTFETSGRW